MRSMTGFGSSSLDSSQGHFEVSVKSLNHRFCSINTCLPDPLEPFDIQIQELIKNRIRRGRIEYKLMWQPTEGTGVQPGVNLKAVEAYVSGLRKIADRFYLKGGINAEILSGLPGVFSFERRDEPDVEKMWKPISEVTLEALARLIEMREREGDAMKGAIAGMIETVEAIRVAIEALVPDRIERARARMKERVEDVLAGKDFDDVRILTEVAILADRWDISEELARLKSHLEQCVATIQADGSAGRRLHFLLQELQREANTITSKAYDVEISHRAVEIKEIVEQIREQVENIE